MLGLINYVLKISNLATYDRKIEPAEDKAMMIMLLDTHNTQA